MRAVSQFLSRYRFEPTEALLRREVVAAIHASCGVRVPERSVRIQGDTAHLTLRPIERSEVFQHYPEIIAQLGHSSIGRRIKRVA